MLNPIAADIAKEFAKNLNYHEPIICPGIAAVQK
jgi:hypothetical protein